MCVLRFKEMENIIVSISVVKIEIQLESKEFPQYSKITDAFFLILSILILII